MTLYRGVPVREIMPRKRPKILFPNEHGAWAMFIIAFLLGWLAAPVFSHRPLLLLPAAIGAFLTRYPLGIYFKKRRVTRALKIPPTYEKKWFLIYSLFTAVVSFPLFYPLGWWWLLLFGAAASLIMALHLSAIIRRKERTFFIEETAVIGLSLLTPAASYAALTHFHPEPLVLWALLVAFNTWRVAVVRGQIARKKERPIDVRGIGKREVCYSSIFLVIVVVLVRLIVTIQGKIPLSP